jgi:quinol monooxygenase YgiN
MMVSENLFFVVELEVKPDQLDDLREVAREMVGLAKDNEPGTLNYEYFFNKDAGICHIYERYVSPDALQAHSASFPQELQTRSQAFRPLRLSAYGTLPDQIREQRIGPISKAVPGFIASFFEPLSGFAR